MIFNSDHLITNPSFHEGDNVQVIWGTYKDVHGVVDHWSASNDMYIVKVPNKDFSNKTVEILLKSTEMKRII